MPREPQTRLPPSRRVGSTSPAGGTAGRGRRREGLRPWTSELISLILLFGMLTLLAIGMPLGFASGFLAAVVMFLKFGPDLLLGSSAPGR